MAASTATDPVDHRTRWISLSQASRLLGASQTALRHWADCGQIPSFRTPGGHRRFSEDDLAALVQAQQVAAPAGVLERWRDKALLGIRRRIHTRGGDSGSWNGWLDDGGRDRMRLFGRQLMALVADAVVRPRARSARLAEARSIGAAYGREGVAGGLPLGDLLQAFVFFRSSLEETTRALVRREGMTPAQVLDLWQHTEGILDGVLLSAVAAYEPVGATPPAVAAPVS